jgi:hypothetical protein
VTPERETRERAVWKAALAPTAECIPLEQLGSALSEVQRTHVSSCPRCQAELALFEEFEASAPVEGEGAAVTWIARDLERRAAGAPPALPRWRAWARIPAWRFSGALAALVMLAGVTAYVSRNRGMLEPGGPSTPVYRSQAVVVSAPLGDLDTAPAEFRWQAVPGAASYTVEVLEVDRHSLWKADSRETHAAVPAQLRRVIVPGKTLVWEVTAKDGAGASIGTSGAQRFRVRTKKAIGGEL